jgi:hypothetical protein
VCKAPHASATVPSPLIASTHRGRGHTLFVTTSVGNDAAAAAAAAAASLWSLAKRPGPREAPA